jgi:D-3-phosphoglycerate dehydrogenase
VKIIRTDREFETPCIDTNLRAWGHELVLLPGTVNEDVLCREVADADLLLTCYTPVTARVIGAAKKLKGIVKYGVGIDAIDIPAAHGCGIEVVNIPDYAEETVAEGAFALLVALTRKLTCLDRRIRSQGWAWPTPEWLGHDIAGKTLGLVGCGRIGTSLARMAGAGFRARVIGYDPYRSREQLAASAIEKYDNLHDLLAEADFISLHAVLNEETRGMIAAAEFDVMRPRALFINTARGALVDEEALLAALKKRTLAGAGLDVFSREPLDSSTQPLKALLTMDNVVVIPHLTFYTVEAMRRLEAETLERCREILAGRSFTIRSSDPRLRPS